LYVASLLKIIALEEFLCFAEKKIASIGAIDSTSPLNATKIVAISYVFD
jgi:hypothetical protein